MQSHPTLGFTSTRLGWKGHGNNLRSTGASHVGVSLFFFCLTPCLFLHFAFAVIREENLIPSKFQNTHKPGDSASCLRAGGGLCCSLSMAILNPGSGPLLMSLSLCCMTCFHGVPTHVHASTPWHGNEGNAMVKISASKRRSISKQNCVQFFYIAYAYDYIP